MEETTKDSNQNNEKLMAWLNANYELYLSDRILLSQADLFHIKKKIDLEKIDEKYKKFIKESQESVDREVNFQLDLLADTELERDKALVLAQESENNRVVIEKLNDELRKKQAVTEEQLTEERKHRLQLSKTNLQGRLATALCILSGIAILCPYVFGIFMPISNELLSHTQNIGILMMNAVMVIVGTLFSDKKNNGDGGSNE